MKITSLCTFTFLASMTAASLAAPAGSESAANPLSSYPKNLARHHMGSNLFLFNATNQSYVPTEAAAAWLDDDVSTGWPALTGQHYYMVALPEPELLTNFAVSARPTSGTINLYAGDEPAAPTAKSWTLLAKDISVDSINDKKLAKPFSRFAKYLLIETNLTDSRPWYGVHLYGEKSAISYRMQKREKSIDARAILGPYVNSQTAFNLSSLYAKSRVAYASSADSYIAWQKIIDDNPESALNVAPSSTDASLVVRYSQPESIQRLSVLADAGARGKLDFYLVSDVEASKPVSQNADADAAYLKVSYPEKSATSPEGPSAPVSTVGLTPVASMVFDGANGRNTIDFPATKASKLLVRWTPDTAGTSLSVREINSFSNFAMNDYEVVSDLAVGELGVDVSKGDGKEPIGEGKEAIGEEGKEPIGQFLPSKDPFLPRGLGFPPNLTQADPNAPQPLSP